MSKSCGKAIRAIGEGKEVAFSPAQGFKMPSLEEMIQKVGSQEKVRGEYCIYITPAQLGEISSKR